MTRETLARLVVRAASLLVPRGERSGWLDEWKAELWHLCRARRSRHCTEADPLECSFGAWQDAFSLRTEQVRTMGKWLLQPGSAQRCGVTLAAATLAALLVCLALPPTRRVLLPLPYRDSGNLVVISSNGEAGSHAPSIRYSDYREWTGDTAALFTGIAWYRPALKNIYFAQHRPAHLIVAESSADLLEVLGIGGVPRRDAAFAGPRLILTRNAWRGTYHSDPQIVGRIAELDGRPLLIAGVLPDRAWRLPGGTDALLLDDAAAFARLAPGARGFAIARIRAQAFPAPRDGWRWMSETRNGITRRFECISIGSLFGRPGSVFVFALILACLALPATTALPLGDYPHRRGPLTRMAHARRWLFLGAKCSLVILFIFFASFALAYGFTSGESVTAVYIQLGTSFPALLFAFRWVLQDQRRRCPECLRLLSNPARVGQASCNFLAWNGTELFCARGHGLLHIPELPTSWFSTQRWLCLDASWRGLFAENGAHSAEIV